MKIPYVARLPSPGFVTIFPEVTQVFKPLITIALRSGEKKQKLFALVDSGADACLFPKGVAEILDIDVRSGQRMDFTGIGGTRTSFYFHEVEILLGDFHVKTKVGFSMVQNIGATGILGQQGFFDNFVVSFDRKNRFIEIQKHGLIHDLASKLPF